MVRDFAAGRLSAFASLTLGFVFLAAPLGAQELIPNGDFELGNSGFASAYSFSPGDISSAKTYDVLADPQAAYGGATSYGDHTSGQGLMMAVNGALDARRDGLVPDRSDQSEHVVHFRAVDLLVLDHAARDTEYLCERGAARLRSGPGHAGRGRHDFMIHFNSG